MQKKKGMFRIEFLTFTALLVALQVIIGNLLQVPLMEKQYNFGFIPIAVAGALLGAPSAMIVGGLGDFLGAHLSPQGAYFPGFTLTLSAYRAATSATEALKCTSATRATRYPSGRMSLSVYTV